MDETEDIYNQIAREFGLAGNQTVASGRTITNVNGTGSFSYTHTVADTITPVADTITPNINNTTYTYADWRPVYPLSDSYEDSVKQILADICDILADLLYKEKLTGDHREDLASIRAFIDSIKVEREDNDV